MLVGDAEGDSVTLKVDSSGVLVGLGKVLGDSVGTLGNCVPSKADGSINLVGLGDTIPSDFVTLTAHG